MKAQSCPKGLPGPHTKLLVCLWEWGLGESWEAHWMESGCDVGPWPCPGTLFSQNLVLAPAQACDSVLSKAFLTHQPAQLRAFSTLTTSVSTHPWPPKSCPSG